MSEVNSFVSTKVAFIHDKDLSIFNLQLEKGDLEFSKFQKKIKDTLNLSNENINIKWFDGITKNLLENSDQLWRAVKYSKNHTKPMCLFVSIVDSVDSHQSNSNSPKTNLENSIEPFPSSSQSLVCKSIAPSNFPHVTHHSILCNQCHSIIIGNRFKCLECIDFDLCCACFMENRHNARHSMLVIRSALLSPAVHKMMHQCQREATHHLQFQTSSSSSGGNSSGDSDTDVARSQRSRRYTLPTTDIWTGANPNADEVDDDQKTPTNHRNISRRFSNVNCPSPLTNSLSSQLLF